MLNCILWYDESQGSQQLVLSVMHFFLPKIKNWTIHKQVTNVCLSAVVHSIAFYMQCLNYVLWNYPLTQTVYNNFNVCLAPTRSSTKIPNHLGRCWSNKPSWPKISSGSWKRSTSCHELSTRSCTFTNGRRSRATQAVREIQRQIFPFDMPTAKQPLYTLRQS